MKYHFMLGNNRSTTEKLTDKMKYELWGPSGQFFLKILLANPKLEIVGCSYKSQRTMADMTLTKLTGSARPDAGMSLFSRINRHASRTPS